MSLPDPEPDPVASVLYVGQDMAGHWLVQQSGKRLEGRFISFAAAMAFARAERLGLGGAKIVLSTAPLVPIVPFAPVEPWESALRHAA